MAKKFAVTWNAPANDGGATITDYDIGYTPSGGTETVVAHGGTTPPHELLDLTDGTTYSVRVRAVNSQGDGAWSSAVSQVAAVASDAPTSLADAPTSGGIDLTWAAPAYTGGSAISDYSVRYTPAGGSATTALIGSTTAAHSLAGLTPGTQYTVEVAAVTAVGVGVYSSSVTSTPLAGGITPNADNRARFYLPAGATAFSVGAASSTGYYRLTDGTNFSPVAGASYHQGSNYWYSYMYHAQMTGLTGTPVLQLFACDAAGSPSGQLYAIDLTGQTQTQGCDAVDISGLGTLTGFQAYSSAAYSSGAAKYAFVGGSVFPRSITEIRAVGTALGGNVATPPSNPFPGMAYYYGGGIDITDQDLDAAALDQLYTDLGAAVTTGQQIVVRLNPGTAGDNPAIATAKNYAVYGS